MNYDYFSNRAISEDRMRRDREREIERQRQERIRDAAPALLHELKCFVQYAKAHPRGCRYSRVREAEAVIALAELKGA